MERKIDLQMFQGDIFNYIIRDELRELQWKKLVELII